MENPRATYICLTCGLLTKRYGHNDNPAGPADFFEVEQRNRENRQLYLEAPGEWRRYEPIPACFVGVASLHTEWVEEKKLTGQDDRFEGFKRVIKRSRGENGCPAWVQYAPGFDPKWHAESSRAEKLDEERRHLKTIWW